MGLPGVLEGLHSVKTPSPNPFSDIAEEEGEFRCCTVTWSHGTACTRRCRTADLSVLEHRSRGSGKQTSGHCRLLLLLYCCTAPACCQLAP